MGINAHRRTKRIGGHCDMIEPLDVERCQAEVPNGATFMTFGGVPGLVRCTSKPRYVLVERKRNKKDKLHGAMTVCTSCFEVFKKQVGEATVNIFEIKGRM